MNRYFCSLIISIGLLFFAGCNEDPLLKHKVLTDFFDGVPDLPPLEQLCEDNMDDLFNVYYENVLAEALAGDIETKKVVVAGSGHPPYVEKDCEGCHNFKNKNLLLAENDKLCEICHVDFVINKGVNTHGPVAVRDCLACHVPHTSAHPSLLQEGVSDICDKCHHEARLAVEMHILVMEHGMECVSCHDAHGGDSHYFLK